MRGASLINLNILNNIKIFIVFGGIDNQWVKRGLHTFYHFNHTFYHFNHTFYHFQHMFHHICNICQERCDISSLWQEQKGIYILINLF